MARKITIPITDHETYCNTGYTITYKPEGETLWASTPWFIPPVELTNLLDDTLYTVRIARNCCDGLQSTPLEIMVDTTILAAPDNFVATPGDTEVALDWDGVAGATSYMLERAEDAAFTINPEVVYTGASTAIMDTELVNGVLYYYRVKASAAYHADSEYSTTSATPTLTP